MKLATPSSSSRPVAKFVLPHSLTDTLVSLQKGTARVIGKLREIAPYAAIEIILPGGSLISLALWYYRHRLTMPRPSRPGETDHSLLSVQFARKDRRVPQHVIHVFERLKATLES